MRLLVLLIPRAGPLTYMPGSPDPAAPAVLTAHMSPLLDPAAGSTCSLWVLPVPSLPVLSAQQPGNVTSAHQASQGLDSPLPSEQRPRSWWCPMRPPTLWPLQPLSCSFHMAPWGPWDTPLSGTFFLVCVQSTVSHLPFSLCSDAFSAYLHACSFLPRAPNEPWRWLICDISILFILPGKRSCPGQGLYLFCSLVDPSTGTSREALSTQQLRASCTDGIMGRDVVH